MANEVQIPLDPNPLGPMEPIFFTGTITPLSQVYANFVRSKLFGKHVREALARGILIASIDANEAKDIARIANAKSDETSERQDNLEERWDAVVSETTDGAEVIEARVDTEGVRQASLSARLLKDFTDRLTKAQLIKFIAGEDIEVTVKSDFTGKIAGSIVENANKILGQNAATVQLPSAFILETSQAGYDLVKLLDGKTYDARYTANTIIAQQLISFDALWILEQNFPSIFKNATTTAEKVTIAKSKIKKFQYKGWAKASGPEGTLCCHSMFNPLSASWVATNKSTGNSIIERLIASTNISTPAYLNADGFYYFVVYANSSDGTIASSVSIDYTSMELIVKFNINEFAVSPSQLEAMRADLQTKLDKLQTLVDTKQDKIVDSGILYPTLAGGAASHPTIQVRYRKIGKEVRWSGRAILPQTTLATQIASTPLAYAPGAELFFPLRVVGAQTDLVANILIKPDGSIWIYSSNNNVQFFSFDNLSYFID